MQVIKNLAKKIVALKSQENVVPLKDLVYLGSTFQGYYVPSNYLEASSICYCVGAGVDISLDVELATMFNSQVFIFDPMPYALDHFNTLIEKTERGEQFNASGGDGKYVYTVKRSQFDTIQFLATGIWNEKKTVKFYSPSKENYPGHSITNLQNTEDYIEAPVDKLVNIMRSLNHQHIDLLKIEIEGSEYVVIEDLLRDQLDIRVILVEFDEFHHRAGKVLATMNRINHSTNKLLKAGYKLVHSLSFYKRTFVRADVFETLQQK
ncbi:hypothetical protein BXP70_16150 [Hymenobacter crusticola]|uniref:Methyltransferase FkbM domain-containing protein n=2 Tax=Hymenobacter crusticola TaxID=1770526 RepID=A0A243WB73_9BACT|nr:hypothetical protein BXP70_16150 [Hymenobacter crusticola]